MFTVFERICRLPLFLYSIQTYPGHFRKIKMKNLNSSESETIVFVSLCCIKKLKPKIEDLLPGQMCQLNLVVLPSVQIVDVETGRTLGSNQEGEVWIRGPQVTTGYLNLPTQTREVFLEDGWVRTGTFHIYIQLQVLYRL